MRRCFFTLLLPLSLAMFGCGGAHSSQNNHPVSTTRLTVPPAGMMYHGVYPGGESGTESDITTAGIQQYVQLSGKRLAWVYFSNNWFQSRAFPVQTATMIRNEGAVPYIRLMLRSNLDTGIAEPVFTLPRIISGAFDQDLLAWAHAAAQFSTPLLVEFGTECNGQWFSWNGHWNGAGTLTGFGDRTKADGPEQFVAAYRHIILLMRNAGARNITWVFHINCADDPDVAWNRLEKYYPGDDVIDWIGISAYGAQEPTETDAQTFRAAIDAVYPRVTALAPSKPVIVAEFGCTTGNSTVAADQWAQAALRDLLSHRWPKIIGFSWWNEQWKNDNNPAHDSNLMLQHNIALATVFHTALTTYHSSVQGQPLSITLP